MTRHGKPLVALVSAADLERLEALQEPTGEQAASSVSRVRDTTAAPAEPRRFGIAAEHRGGAELVLGEAQGIARYGVPRSAAVFREAGLRCPGRGGRSGRRGGGRRGRVWRSWSRGTVGRDVRARGCPDASGGRGRLRCPVR
ncbi:hypothetical protein [Streptomyces sp. AC602_WCS936]|uniref:hypothetical protein n=1 Tax=Streptomyces sp. AC602_WCS936 TaxID=2823685 RepID=UPI0035B4581C